MSVVILELRSSFIFGKISSKHSSQIDSLSVSHFSSTIIFTQQFSQQILSLLNNSLKIMASSSHNINKHTGAFFLKTFIILWYRHQRAFCMISFYHTEWKLVYNRVGFNKVNIFPDLSMIFLSKLTGNFLSLLQVMMQNAVTTTIVQSHGPDLY